MKFLQVNHKTLGPKIVVLTNRLNKGDRELIFVALQATVNLAQQLQRRDEKVSQKFIQLRMRTVSLIVQPKKAVQNIE
jgi:hypothetical protein